MRRPRAHPPTDSITGQGRRSSNVALRGEGGSESIKYFVKASGEVTAGRAEEPLEGDLCS